MRVRLALVAAVSMVAMAAGCSAKTATVQTSPVQTGGGTAPAAGQPTAAASQAKTAKVGDTLNLASQLMNQNFQVTLVKLVDPARSDNEYETPAAGKRYVAVQLRIKNLDAAPYTDSPIPCTTAQDASGQSFNPTFADTTVGQGFSSLHVAQGGTALGVVVFEVPTGDKLTTLQFTPAGGMGSDTGQWDLG